MLRADYDSIADFYDFARPLSERSAELWLSLIQRILPPGNVRLLDLGCGTGRFALPIAKRLQVQVTGADSSEAMLAHDWISGELLTFYHDWRIEFCTEEVFDCMSSGVPHQHAVNRVIARKDAGRPAGADPERAGGSGS